MRKSVWVLMALLLCGLLLTGCKGEKSPVVGKWECVDSGEQVVYEFKRDGSMEYSVVGLGASITGQYAVEGNEIRLTLDSGDETVLEFSRQDKQLILSDQGGHSVTCTKK